MKIKLIFRYLFCATHQSLQDGFYTCVKNIQQGLSPMAFRKAAPAALLTVYAAQYKNYGLYYFAHNLTGLCGKFAAVLSHIYPSKKSCTAAQIHSQDFFAKVPAACQNI